MNTIDLDYRMVVDQIMRGGEETETRNGKVMRSFYPFVIRCNKAPIVGWRKINHHLGIREMEWFLRGRGVLSWADKSIRPWWEPFSVQGEVGRNSYFTYFLALGSIIKGIRKDPYGRRHLFSAWNSYDMNERVEEGYLPNCHSTVCQFYVDNHKRLHYKTYQRSADVMLGLPYNLIQHWALLEYVAYRTGNKVGTMSYILGDAHIYESHFEAARELLAAPMPKNEAELIYQPSGDEFNASDFSIVGNIDYPVKRKLKMEV